MNTKRTVVIAIAFLSTMLVGQQTPATGKSEGSSAAPKVFTGIVSDSMCGAQHMAKDKSAAECTRKCVKVGMKYALVVEKKAYTLEGHEAELDKVTGLKATVKGKVSGETIAVQSVVPAMKMN